MSTPANEIICYGQTGGNDWTQEYYETASRHAGVRARQLRKQGIKVAVEGMGASVTSVGLVKLTLLTIQASRYDLPQVRVERL